MKDITITGSFLTDPKTQRARAKGGEAVVTLWVALKGYVAEKGTSGFIPDDAIDHLPGAPRKPHARRALVALVECGLRNADGVRGSGLVDPVTHGWQIHEYEEHESDVWALPQEDAPEGPPAPLPSTLTPARLEARRKGGLARATSRDSSGRLTSNRPATVAGGSPATDQQRRPAKPAAGCWWRGLCTRARVGSRIRRSGEVFCSYSCC